MKRLLTIFLMIGCFASLVGCSLLPIREYQGTEVSSLIFKSIDYMGGATSETLLDFENNLVKHRNFLPGANVDAPEFETVKEFTEEEEKILIDKLYSYGLFSIRNNYPSPPGIMDGGGWDLVIEYADGTEKRSSGSNNSPRGVFRNCAKAFYDLCEMGIVAGVPSEYYCPPNISYSFVNGNSHYGYSSYGERVEYKWNGFESSEVGVYEANENLKTSHEFISGEEYKLIIYTSNYGSFNEYPRFTKCTVTSYDYNKELTGEKVVYNSGWFKQEEIDIELNKIYTLRLDFDNGDYVVYTFNTKPGSTEYSFEELYNVSRYIDLDKITEVRVDRSNTTAMGHILHDVNVMTDTDRIAEVVDYINSTSFTKGGEAVDGGGMYNITLISDGGSFEFSLMPRNAAFVGDYLYTSSLDFPFVGTYNDFYTYIKPYGEIQLSTYGDIKTLTDFDISEIKLRGVIVDTVGPNFRKDVELIIEGYTFKVLEPNMLYSSNFGWFEVVGEKNLAELIPEGVSSSLIQFVTEDGDDLGMVIVSNNTVYDIYEIGDMLRLLCGGTLLEVKNSKGESFEEWIFTNHETLTVSYIPRC